MRHNVPLSLLLGLLILAGCRESTDPGHGNNEPPAPDGPIHFTASQDEAGIRFTHFNSRRDSLIPEDVGSGVGWADYDNDGDEDLYFVNFAGPFLMDPATKFSQFIHSTKRIVNGAPMLEDKKTKATAKRLLVGAGAADS